MASKVTRAQEKVRRVIATLDPKKIVAYRGLLLLDQVCFSVANFVLTITLARAYSETAFAAFGIGLSIALIACAVQRNLYVLRYSLLTPRTGNRYLPGIIAEHLITVIVVTLPVGAWAVASIALQAGAFPVYLAVSTLVCALIYCQVELDRAVQIKRGSARGALLLSFLYFLVVLLLAALAFWLALPFELFMAGLSAFAIVKGLWLATFIARPRWNWGWRLLVVDMRRYGLAAVLNAATASGFTNVPVLILGMTSAQAQVASLVAMRSLMQPLALVIRSFDAADKNRFRAASGGTVAGARRLFWRTFSVYAIVPLIGLMLIGIAPEALIRLAYDGKYAGSGPLMLAWGVFAILMGMTRPIWSVVRIFDKDRDFVMWQTASAVLGTLLAATLCPSLGAAGAMIAALCGISLTVIGGLATNRTFAFGSADGPMPSEREGRPAASRKPVAAPLPPAD